MCVCTFPVPVLSSRLFSLVVHLMKADERHALCRVAVSNNTFVSTICTVDTAASPLCVAKSEMENDETRLNFLIQAKAEAASHMHRRNYFPNNLTPLSLSDRLLGTATFMYSTSFECL